MFTGIIEATGLIRTITREGDNIHYEVESAISAELHVDQSLSHDGVCLTVTKVADNRHWVTAIAETLRLTALGGWTEGTVINLERAMMMNARSMKMDPG